MKYKRKRTFWLKITDTFPFSSKNFSVLSLLLIVLALPLTVFFSQKQQQTRQHAAGTGMPHVAGNLITNGNGNPLILRGAQIETSFNVMNAWQKGQSTPLYPPKLANATVFSAMANQWHMNVLRFPISNWVYDWDNSSQGTHTYLSLLDQVIQQANQAGLYVVLDLHDDQRAGSPYADSGNAIRVATSEMETFWKTIAAHYMNNPMVMYDLLNEPYEYPDWQTWYQGGQMNDTAITPNQTITAVGLQQLVTAIRSTGSQQIVVIESWQKPSPGGGFYGMPLTDIIQDSLGNVVYSYHTYTVQKDNPTRWDSLWGPILGKYPRYVGEWAYLPNPYNKTIFMCMNQAANQVYTAAQATQGVTNFLNYLDQNQISWTAWQFDQYHLVQDETTFSPTQLNDAEIPCCGAGPSATCNYGMGTLIQNFILSHPTPTYIPTPPLTDTPTPRPTNTPTLTPTLSPTVPVPTNFTPTPTKKKCNTYSNNPHCLPI